jgi:peptidoglycan/LPS O-acetylase OafA/YrhL
MLVNKKPSLSNIDFSILESIRGLSAFYVLMAHSRGLLWIGGQKYLELHPKSNWSLYDYIFIGLTSITRIPVEFVIIFFIVSGFSIAHSLNRPSSILGFYKRRFFRLYPAYLGALLWAWLGLAIAQNLHPSFFNRTYDQHSMEIYYQMNGFTNIETIIRNLFFIPSKGFITPFWSLTYEVLFYLSAPILLKDKTINWYVSFSILFWVYRLIFPNVLDSQPLGLYLSKFIFEYNIYFVIGICLYKKLPLINKTMDKKSLYYNNLIKFFCPIFLFLTYIISVINKGECVYSFITASIFGCLLIVYFLKNQVNISFFKWVGKFSYTLYITNVTTLMLVHSLIFRYINVEPPYITNILFFFPGVIISISIAYIHYCFFEKRSMQILEKIRSQKKK